VAQGVPGRLRPRIFLTFRHYKGSRSSPIHTGCLYPRRNPWYSFSEAQSTSEHMILLGEPRKKSPVTPPGIGYWYGIFLTKLMLPLLPWQALCKKYSKLILVQPNISLKCIVYQLSMNQKMPKCFVSHYMACNRTIKQVISILSYDLGHD